MTVEQIATRLNAEILNLPFPERDFNGVYCGDLLSWVMGHAKPDNLWVTIMTNINVLAVASLIDLSCVIVCENAQLDEGFLETAKNKEINIIRCQDDSYNVCSQLYKVSNE